MSGELDFALDVPLTAADGIGQHKIISVDFCLAVRRNHPLSSKPLTKKSWIEAKHIAVSGRSRGTVVEDLFLQRMGIERNVRLKCQNYFTACSLVVKSDLVLVLPRPFGHTMKEFFDIQFLDLPVPFPALDVYLYWPKANDNSPAHTWAREFIIKHSNSYVAEYSDQ